MDIKLVYRDNALGDAWKIDFKNCKDVEIIEADICTIKADAIVSPANSFGFMDGGLDYFLSERFGWKLQEDLQKEIQSRPLRELLVGEALVLPTGDATIPWLISAPTMRVPMKLRQSVNVYLAMKAILSTIKKHGGINTVAIPGLGTGLGGLKPEIASHQMYEAYKEVGDEHKSFPSDFGDAQKRHLKLNNEIMIWD